MSEKWTPDPWVYGFPMQYSTHQDMPATPSPEADQVFLLDGDDYLRTVACVNACVGMADPAKELAALRDQNAAMRKALELAEDEIHHDERCSRKPYCGSDDCQCGMLSVRMKINRALATQEPTQ